MRFPAHGPSPIPPERDTLAKRLLSVVESTAKSLYLTETTASVCGSYMQLRILAPLQYLVVKGHGLADDRLGVPQLTMGDRIRADCA